MTPKLRRFLDEARPATPCLALDLDRVEANHAALQAALPDVALFYAVKANPARPILERLARLGASFDAASRGEIGAVLVARKDDGDPRRWVYLDIGRFGGLAETAGDAIRYRITSRRDGPTGPVILAGPTCDGTDVLYERTPYELPLDLAVGDRLEIGCAGAYTTTYASTGFNGFAPLEEHYV